MEFDKHYPFMLGFGLPMACASMSLDVFVGNAVFSLFFPIAMMLAIISSPRKHKYGYSSLKVFLVPQKIIYFLLRSKFKDN